MKITLIREERESGKEAVSTQETDMLMEKLKTENKTGYITELRSIIPHLKGTNARYEHIDRLPRLYPAVEMTRTKAGEHRIKTYNGLVLLEVNNLAGVAEAELVKQQAALLPQTFAAFCGSSGRSAKIWVRFTLPDGGLPKNEDDIALFHAHAYRLAVKCYQPLLPFPITLQAPSLLQSCRMTVDEQPYYSPTAVAFCLEQPCALPSEDNYRQRKQQESNPLLRMTPGYEVADTCNLLFEAALDRAFRDLDNWRRGDDLRPLLSRLAEHCFKAGIPEEEAVRQTLMHYYREADETLVRLTLHNLYGGIERLRHPQQPEQRPGNCFPAGGVHETPLRIPLQHRAWRLGIPAARLHPLLLPTCRPARTQQHRHEGTERGSTCVGPRHYPLPVFGLRAAIQPHRRISL